MNTTLIKALIALIPAGLLFIRSASLAHHQLSAASLLQLCGSACLVIVVLTHIAEALHFLPFMGWGEQHSAGHYLDLASAVLSVTLLPVRYWMTRRKGSGSVASR
jgi:hypothetical protein